MKVVFLQGDSFIKLAIEILCAVLKKAGHECQLLLQPAEKDIIRAALDSGADMFAFSCTTGSDAWVMRTAEKLKKRTSTPVIVGGPHATFYPDIIKKPYIDYVCRGEGEHALVELLGSIRSNPDGVREIKNIWSKDASGRVFETDVRPFMQDLDELPFPDFPVYARYKYLVPFYRDMYPVITMRGCAKNCSFCFNETYKKIYLNKGKYLRRRSPENVIGELLEAKKKFGVRKINFVDDSFFLYPQWVKEFSSLYREKVALPYIINVEAANVTDSLVRTVKESGCICARMGVESGNDGLRQIVLNKKVTSAQIREAAAHIKAHGLKLNTYNILGLPGETVESAMETYVLNKEIGADFASCSLLQPYPGTAIYDYVKKHGYLKEGAAGAANLSESFFAAAGIRLEHEKEITNLQDLMQLFIQLRIPPFLAKEIIKLPTNALFHIVFRLSFVLSKMRIQRIRPLPLLRLALHSLSYMSRGASGAGRAANA